MSRGKSVPTPVREVSTKRPGGRTAENSRRIREATIALLVEGGFEAVTFQDVASRAGVGRATLYRRWESPATLVRDAVLETLEAEIAPVDTGSLRGDMEQLLSQIGRFISSPIGVAALMANLAQMAKPDDKQANQNIWLSRLEAIAPVFQRAVDRGELSEDQDVEVMFARVAGALYFRVIVMGETIDDAWIDRVLSDASLS
eukprot:s1_g619.t1